jgi:HrpA-like RNA helicase
MEDDTRDKQAEELLQEIEIDFSDLPVRQFEADIISAVSSSPVTIVTGETGSGKTTQLPQMLLDAPSILGESKLLVAVTQPRRVAAISVARRVSTERKCQIGTEVGYAVRFEEQRSRETRLIYLTDGTLLREMLTDPLLTRCCLCFSVHADELMLQIL